MKIAKKQLKQIIKEEIEIVLNEVNPAAQAIRDDIAAHQNVESTPARSGRDIATELGYDEAEKTDPLAGMDPELVNAAAYRLRQQIEEFRNHLREPWKYGGKAEPVNLSADQAKAIFLAAIAQL